MNPKEIRWLREYANFNDNSGIVRERMNILFKPRMFSASLVIRQLSKFRAEIFGKNGMSMNNLMDIGKQILISGGVFETEHDEYMRIKSVIVQSKEMRKYAEIYNDFCVLDGTHSTNQYKLVLMPVTLVDCLGSSIIIIHLVFPCSSLKA